MKNIVLVLLIICLPICIKAQPYYNTDVKNSWVDQNTFINASPSKTTCKKGAATATSSKKACTKPCTKSKTAKMETSAKAADAKLVKNEMEN